MVLLQFSVDSGMIVVIFICLGYLLLVIGLLFFVKNDWCDLLFRNMTVGFYFFFIFQTVLLTNPIWIPLWHCHYCPKWHPFVLFRRTWSVDPRATTRSVKLFELSPMVTRDPGRHHGEQRPGQPQQQGEAPGVEEDNFNKQSRLDYTGWLELGDTKWTIEHLLLEYVSHISGHWCLEAFWLSTLQDILGTENGDRHLSPEIFRWFIFQLLIFVI